MATEQQIAVNRENAKHSTGPRTELGKSRSKRNALRHGLTGETLLVVEENAAAYRALKRAIYADYCPRSKFELELVARLVSLLWRLRRARCHRKWAPQYPRSILTRTQTKICKQTRHFLQLRSFAHANVSRRYQSIVERHHAAKRGAIVSATRGYGWQGF